jgi:CRISPR-associated endoribonuclease Cas6
MLHSILFSLTAASSYPILGPLGRPAQAWVLNQIMRHHSRLAATLHDEGGIKPYTVSTLLDRHGRPHKAGDWLKEGQECWLRVTTIGDELSEVVLRKVLKKLPKTLTLYKMDFRIDGYTLNPRDYSWAGQSSFAEIAQEEKYEKGPCDIRMEFVSPTAFRNNRRDISLPIPGKVFRSLAEKWNAFCPETMQLHELWPGFADDCIIVNEMTAVNTVHWEFAEGTRGAATGFTGTVGFSLLSKANAPKQWQAYWDGADVVMRSLVGFAFYCGVGHHTTIGMGQSRALHQDKQKAGTPGRKPAFKHEI